MRSNLRYSGAGCRRVGGAVSAIRRRESRTFSDERTSESSTHLRTRSLSNGLLLLRHAQSGQGMVEYGMIMVLVGLVVLAMLVTTGHQVMSLYSNITSTLHLAGV